MRSGRARAPAAGVIFISSNARSSAVKKVSISAVTSAAGRAPLTRGETPLQFLSLTLHGFCGVRWVASVRR